MPEKNPRIPKISLHKGSGLAVVRLGGKDFYLGPWESDEAKAEYDRIVAEWLVGGRRPSGSDLNDVSVSEVIAAFWEHAETYYREPDGTPASELHNLRDALRPLRRLYGHTPAAKFGPLALKAVRQDMIGARLCRTSINRRISRVKHVFKWAVENELIRPSVHHGLQAVAGLRAGRSDARESAPVQPVAAEHVHAVLPCLSRQVGAMIQLQLITGMRPGEVTRMRTVDIETTGRIWVYRPHRHKTQCHGHDRLIFLGPKAQEIVKAFLKAEVNAYIFSPADAEQERREKKHRLRKTPMSCGNVPGSNVRRKRRISPGDHYEVTAYAKAVMNGCDAAFPLPPHLDRRVLNERRQTIMEWTARLTPAEKTAIKSYRKLHRWHPHQLRHSAATNLRKTYGLEVAQIILGHKTLTVTQVYAEKNVEAAMRIMAEVG